MQNLKMLYPWTIASGEGSGREGWRGRKGRERVGTEEEGRREISLVGDPQHLNRGCALEWTTCRNAPIVSSCTETTPPTPLLNFSFSQFCTRFNLSFSQLLSLSAFSSLCLLLCYWTLQTVSSHTYTLHHSPVCQYLNTNVWSGLMIMIIMKTWKHVFCDVPYSLHVRRFILHWTGRMNGHPRHH